LAGRAAIWPAIAPKELEGAIEAATEPAMELVEAIGQVMEWVPVIGPQAQVRTA